LAIFPEPDWFTNLSEKLNLDPTYGRVAGQWEGDLLFIVEADDVLDEPVAVYLDLWHGKCREAAILSDPEERPAAFTIRAPYWQFVRVLTGEVQPMQALLTRKLQVQGNLPYLVRNVPTVLEFVRCCREITTGVHGLDRPGASDPL
jgi:putative sterol carrier protein